MKRVRRTCVMLAFLLAITVSWVAVATAAVEVEGGAYVGVFDKYLWRGFDLSGSQPVAQGGMDLTVGGFTLSYWSNVQLASDDGEGLIAGEATETDIILDYSFDLSEMVWVSVGNLFYIVEEDFPNTHELYLSVGLNTILEPSVSVYYDWDEADEDGLFFTASVGHSFDLIDNLSLAVGGLASYNQKSDFNIGDYSDWHNAEFSVGVDYLITDQISLSPTFVYSTPLSDDAEDIAGIDDELVSGLTIALSF